MSAGLRWRLDMAVRALDTDETQALYHQADRCGFLAHLQPDKRARWRQLQIEWLLRAQTLAYRTALAQRILAAPAPSNEER